MDDGSSVKCPTCGAVGFIGGHMEGEEWIPCPDCANLKRHWRSFILGSGLAQDYKQQNIELRAQLDKLTREADARAEIDFHRRTGHAVTILAAILTDNQFRARMSPFMAAKSAWEYLELLENARPESKQP